MNTPKGTILIIDDNPLVRINQVDILEASGFLCVSAGTIRQALRLIQMRQYSLIICDHDLPDGKGTLLLNKLVEFQLRTPVIYISAATDHILNKIRCAKQVKRVIRKPIGKEMLLKEVHQHFSKSEEKLFPRFIDSEERNMLLQCR